MKNNLFISAIVFILGITVVSVVWSDDDEYRTEYGRQSTGVAAVSNPEYQDECGACHMAYPPGLLSSGSWQKMMSDLENHFGDNAELDAKTYKTINHYLQSNSAEKSDYRRSKGFASTAKSGDYPIRITETAYFKREHNEVPARMVTGNKEVNSFSNCNACHRKAEQGSFREQDIIIPGFGSWDD